MKLSVSLQFTRSWTFGRTPWTGDQLVARPLPVHTNTEKRTNTNTKHPCPHTQVFLLAVRYTSVAVFVPPMPHISLSSGTDTVQRDSVTLPTIILYVLCGVTLLTIILCVLCGVTLSTVILCALWCDIAHNHTVCAGWCDIAHNHTVCSVV
jgi:hypothetical protein